MRELERDFRRPPTRSRAIVRPATQGRVGSHSPPPPSAPGSTSAGRARRRSTPAAGRAACSASPTRRSTGGGGDRRRDPPLRYAGHTSGATAGRARAAGRGAATFSLHPLQTVPTATPISPAVRARSPGPRRAGARARSRRAPGMRPFEPEESRAAYHARRRSPPTSSSPSRSRPPRCSSDGREDARELLAPLVLRTAANWAERGPEPLTGPIARGDETRRPPPRGARARPPRAAAALRGARRPHPRAREPGDDVRIARTRPSCASARRRPPRRQALDRPGADDGRLHDGHLALLRAARARCDSSS